MNTSQIKEIVKKSVSTAIQICGGTQSALAEKAGLTQGAIGKYLRGEAIPRGETANKLSKAVNGKLQPCDFAPHIFVKTTINHTSPINSALSSNDATAGAGAGVSHLNTE